MNVKILTAFAAVALLAACSDDTSSYGGSGTGSAMGTGANGSANGAGGVAGSQDDLTANVGDRVYFDYDMSTLKGEGRATLDRQAAWLARYARVSVQVAGNCDERGTEEYNIAIGQRRASAARDYLVAKGVASARVTTISYGKDRPTALGSNEAAWAQNRNAITSVR
ncbi:MAG: peptidoglycan-associated lipoprotein Pal [Acetobacteraceae bacterium]|nr:peptidoglycan-associated lipoprotein Pal [Acetobacteraceae bacterium]